MSLAERYERAAAFARLREQHPEIPAAKAWGYVNSDGSESLEEFLCPGHEWAYTGTAYGGDDERWHGEGRAYCIHCGKDGDA